MTTISVDLGGSRVKMGVVESGKILEKQILPSHADKGLAHLLPLLEPLLSDWRRRYPVDGLGFAFPSLVDIKRSEIVGTCGKFDDWQKVDLHLWAREKFGVPLILENDANAAAIGEHACGAACGCDDFVLMILGTGIGAAAMMDGRLIRGKHFQAGVLMGHIPLKTGGRKCTACGFGEGCAEAQASTWALPGIVRESSVDSMLKNEKTVNFEVLKRYYDKGDPLARAVFAECCEYWANLLIAMVCAYDPELIVLSGGVLNWGEELTEKLHSEVLRRAFTPWGKLRFSKASDPEASVLLGLYELVRQNVSIGKEDGYVLRRTDHCGV